MRWIVIVASLLALALTRVPSGRPTSRHAIPALAAAPVLKLRLFYAGLLLCGLISLLPQAGDAPYYLLLILFLGGLPILGHQTIGLTAARHESPVARQLWLLGLVFPVLVLGFGIALLVDRAM